MTRLSNKKANRINHLPFLASRAASFGKAHDQKNSFRINKMPQMARMTRQKCHGGDSGTRRRKKESEKECK